MVKLENFRKVPGDIWDTGPCCRRALLPSGVVARLRALPPGAVERNHISTFQCCCHFTTISSSHPMLSNLPQRFDLLSTAVRLTFTPRNTNGSMSERSLFKPLETHCFVTVANMQCNQSALQIYIIVRHTAKLHPPRQHQSHRAGRNSSWYPRPGHRVQEVQSSYANPETTASPSVSLPSTWR